jgi:hypothetical protein
MEIERAWQCYSGMSKWDAKWGDRHAFDISIWKLKYENAQKLYDQTCKKKECEK